MSVEAHDSRLITTHNSQLMTSSTEARAPRSRYGPYCGLYSPAQRQDHQDDQDQPQRATTRVAPITAVRPRRHGTEKHQHENHHQDGYHTVLLSSLAIAIAIPGDEMAKVRP